MQDSTGQTRENTYCVHSACTFNLQDEDNFTKNFLLNVQLKKSSYIKENTYSLTLMPLHLPMHKGNSTPLFQYHYLQFLEFQRFDCESNFRK